MKHLQVELAAEARAVATGRRHVLRLLQAAGAPDGLADAAALAASEAITNAVVHAGTEICLDVWASGTGIRVEVFDGSVQLPVMRPYAATSGTGRGLRIIDDAVDQWGVDRRPDGKTVWFEIGQTPTAPDRGDPSSEDRRDADAPLSVTLRNMPLLMHLAWQEHAQALLREYLLFSLESDPGAIDRHAQASDALSLLYAQLPLPRLPDDPELLVQEACEPVVSAEHVRIDVPPGSVPHFATLDTLLGDACDAAGNGHLLGPPTQPEISEMREWVCGEVLRQSEGRPAEAWSPRTSVRVSLADAEDIRARYEELSDSDEALLATDEASIIVAATPPILRFLGYSSESELLGRRILAVVPTRYRQAHVAGTTLNATEGRAPLLDLPLTLPVVRADGTETIARFTVSPRLLHRGVRVFVATFDLTAVPA